MYFHALTRVLCKEPPEIVVMDVDSIKLGVTL